MSNIVIAIIFFVVGIIVTLIAKYRGKYDGRLVIGENEYFVAITIPPEEIERKEEIVLKVFKK